MSTLRYRPDAFYRSVDNESVKPGALGMNAAEVAPAKAGIAAAGPGFGETHRQVLRVDTPIERTVRCGPDFPGGLRPCNCALEPCLLFGAQQCDRRFVLAEIRNGLAIERNRRRRVFVGIGRSRPERFQ